LAVARTLRRFCTFSVLPLLQLLTEGAPSIPLPRPSLMVTVLLCDEVSLMTSFLSGRGFFLPVLNPVRCLSSYFLPWKSWREDLPETSLKGAGFSRQLTPTFFCFLFGLLPPFLLTPTPLLAYCFAAICVLTMSVFLP